MSRFVGAMLLGVLVLLTGCGSPPASAWPSGMPPRNATLTERPITLRVWMAADYANQSPIVDLVDAFQEAYPNITIELSGYDWQQMAGKVQLAISQGAPPDIAHQHAFAMGAQGMAEPLDDLWQQWAAEKEFTAGAMDDVTWKGRRYGVPLDINTLFMFYNKTAFKDAGLALPGSGYTFAQLRSDLEQLTAPDKEYYGIALSASGWGMYGLLRSNGGELLHEDGDQVSVSLDDPQAVETLRFFSDLGRLQLGTLPPPQPRQSDHPVVLFSERKVALFFGGPFDLARLKKEAPPEVFAEVGTAPLPVPKPDSPSLSVLGGGSLFVPKGAEHREAAFEFMKWAVSDRYALRMAQEMGRYPVRIPVYRHPYFRTEPLLMPFLEQLKTARPHKLEAYASANAVWSKAVHDVYAPGANVDVIMSYAQKQAQEAIQSGD